MPIKASEFDKVVKKFGFDVKVGDHIRARLFVDKKLVVRTKRSHKSAGRDLPHDLIRNQLHLTETQLQDAIDCPLDRDGYIKILEQKGIIQVTQ